MYTTKNLLHKNVCTFKRTFFNFKITLVKNQSAFLITIITLLFSSISFGQNLIDSSDWLTDNIGRTSNFSQAGNDSNNSRVILNGPYNEDVTAWKITADGGAGTDGGFRHAGINVSTNKTYRMTYWVKSTGSSNCGNLTGFTGSTVDHWTALHFGRNDGQSTQYPFSSTNSVSNNQWYLVVSYIGPSGFTSPVNAGIYNPNVGSASNLPQPAYPAYEFTFPSGHSQLKIRTRADLWECTAGDEMYIYDPRIEETSSMLSFSELLYGNQPQTNTNTSGTNGTELYTDSNAASPSNESNDIAGWSSNQGVNLSSVSGSSYNGNYHLKIESTRNGWLRGEYAFDAEIGKEYEIKIHAKHNSQNNPGFYAWDGFAGFGDGQAITSTSWTEYSFNLTADKVRPIIRVYAGASRAVGGSLPGDAVYIDNISIIEVGSEPDNPTPPSGDSVWNSGTNGISYNGSVGIGTSNPKTKLDVMGDLQAEASITVTGSGSGSYKVAMNAMSDGYIVGRDNSFDEKFRITAKGNSYFNGGNVGIGVINPGSWKLAVNGKVRATEVKVESDWADYVFNDDYQLPTLQEVEQHIEDKGHLINIPSAAEVEANGILLGEMNKLLLEKIEELTLYILEQEKRIQMIEFQMQE